MKSTLQYYRPQSVSLDDNTVLVSGNCPMVKAVFLAEQLKKSSAANYLAVVIDFAGTGDFSGILDNCGYHARHIFITGRDNYKCNEVPVRTAVSMLRTHAQRLGYDHAACAQITLFLNFLMQLEPPGEKSSTIQQLLRKFNNQEKLENILVELVRKRILSKEQAKDHVQTYLEYVLGGLTADTLLSEIQFLVEPDSDRSSFSLSQVHPGEAAILCASDNNSTDINDYMTRLWTSDLIDMSRNTPLMVIINTGHHSQIERMYELTETFSNKPNISLFYSAYDLFAGVSEEKAKAFSKLFRYNLYGTHANDSAIKISSMFPDRWITQMNYSDAQNKRIFGESLLDKLLNTDHTKTVSTSLIKESVCPAHDIVDLGPREYILFDTFINTVRSANIYI